MKCSFEESNECPVHYSLLVYEEVAVQFVCIVSSLEGTVRQ